MEPERWDVALGMGCEQQLLWAVTIYPNPVEFKLIDHSSFGFKQARHTGVEARLVWTNATNILSAYLAVLLLSMPKSDPWDIVLVSC